MFNIYIFNIGLYSANNVCVLFSFYLKTNKNKIWSDESPLPGGIGTPKYTSARGAWFNQQARNSFEPVKKVRAEQIYLDNVISIYIYNILTMKQAVIYFLPIKAGWFLYRQWNGHGRRCHDWKSNYQYVQYINWQKRRYP